MPAVTRHAPVARRWRSGPAPRLAALAAGNRLFVAVFVPAALLRADAELGYRWQSWFNDSFAYVASAITLVTDPIRVSGYSVFLWLLEPFHSYALVTITQHLMGLAMGVMVYALARHRFAAPGWIAALAAVPVLYDGFQIQLEHLIMPDVLFEFLVMLAVTLLLWDRQPSWRRCALAGLLIGLSALMRSVGLPLLAVFAAYLVVRRVRWRAVAACVAACALPVLGYAGWYDLEHGQFGMTASAGVFLYSRVMTFAECPAMNPPPDLLELCTTVPPARRPIAQAYIWGAASPLNRFPAPEFSPLPNRLAKEFAIRAIEAQPLAYARAVADDTWRAFEWNRTVFPNAATYDEYLFGTQVAVPPSDARRAGGYSSYAAAYGHGNPQTRAASPFAAAIRGYQRYAWLPGTVYGLILLTGLGGLVLAWRRAGGAALLPWAVSLALIVIPAATAEFGYRYVLPAVPLAALALAMAFGRDTAHPADARDDQGDLAADGA
ncbi:MAG: hypothetical protein JOY82_27760 [Streptosporangiaceae bacterium]|nr:hypothetical protein [Streptosporangiaceae bacterium]